MTSPHVTVAIPTWNGRHHLELCLPALEAQTYRDFEIVVIDNGSTDGTVAWLRDHYPAVRVVALPNNLGVTAAFNVAIHEARGEFLVLLNNDTQAEPAWLAELVAAAERHPTAGSVASKMKVWNDRARIHTAGDYYTVGGRPGNRGVWQADDGRFDEEEWVFGACGGAALYRRDLFDRVGRFDERLQSYLEDVDLAWRAQLAGYGAIFAPRAVVYHRISATGGGAFASFYNGRNWIYVLVKNMPASLLRRYWPAVMREQLRVTWDALKAWRGAAARARLRGQVAGLLALPRLLKWRREVQAARTATDEQLLRVLSLEPE